MMHSEASIFYLDILKHEHADMESAKANMVAHVLRSTDTTHSIRKVTLLILTIDELKHKNITDTHNNSRSANKTRSQFFPSGSSHPFC